MKSIWPTCLMLAVPLLLFSQSKKITSFQTASEITATAVDRAGDFYLLLKSGEIHKHDKNGNKIAQYTHGIQPTLFDPTNAIRLLAYFKEEQKYTWLSPELQEGNFHVIDSVIAIEPLLLCPSGDFNLWVLDQSDLSLKRYNPKTLKVFSEFSIRNQFSEKTSFSLMREYQSFLFLFDPQSGIYIYNAMGKQIKKIEVTGLDYFNFLGEELYYQQDGYMKFIDLFTTETRDLKLEKPGKFVLLTDERMISVKQNQVEVFEFVP